MSDLDFLVCEILDENEARLYLKKSEEEYKDFLARVISSATIASYRQVKYSIESFLMCKNSFKCISYS